MDLKELIEMLENEVLTSKRWVEEEEQKEQVREFVLKLYSDSRDKWMAALELASTLKEPQPAQAETDWLAKAVKDFNGGHEAALFQYTAATAAAAIAQAQAAERQAVAMEELAKTVKSIYKHGIG